MRGEIVGVFDVDSDAGLRSSGRTVSDSDQWQRSFEGNLIRLKAMEDDGTKRGGAVNCQESASHTIGRTLVGDSGEQSGGADVAREGSPRCNWHLAQGAFPSGGSVTYAQSALDRHAAHDLAGVWSGASLLLRIRLTTISRATTGTDVK